MSNSLTLVSINILTATFLLNVFLGGHLKAISQEAKQVNEEARWLRTYVGIHLLAIAVELKRLRELAEAGAPEDSDR